MHRPNPFSTIPAPTAKMMKDPEESDDDDYLWPKDNDTLGSIILEKNSAHLCLYGKKAVIHKNDSIAHFLHNEQHMVVLEKSEDCGYDDNHLHSKQQRGEENEYDTNDSVTQRSRSTGSSSPVQNVMDPNDVRLLLDVTDKVFSSSGVITSNLNEICHYENETKENHHRRTWGPGSTTTTTPHCQEEIESTNNRKKHPKDCPEDSSNRIKDDAFLQQLDANLFLPDSQRQYDIVKKTAYKCFDNPQLTVFLRLKQSYNPEFRFLDPQDNLHPLFKAMLNFLSLEETAKKDPLTENDSNSKSTSTVGSLLHMYASSEDDDDHEEPTKEAVHSNNETNPHQVTNLNRNKDVARTEPFCSDLACSDGGTKKDAKLVKGVVNVTLKSTDKTRADRLKRARMMKAHFANKIKKTRAS